MSPHNHALATSPAVGVPAPRPAPPATRRAPRPDADRILALLHESHGTELLRFCRWMLRDDEEAHDALQDTWIRALGALRDSRVGVAAHRPWLFAIARNVCLDRLRERGRTSHQEVDDEAMGGGPAPDEVLTLRQEAGAALAMVGALPERQRAALLMREVAGMSMVEIADALGVSVERAHWAIADARRSLEQARSGSTVECEDVRSRLVAGRRGRTVRSHLESCAACRSHDRRANLRRLLSPFFLPLLWMRNLSLGAVMNPAAAATVAFAVGTAAHPPVDRPVPAPAPVSAAAEVGPGTVSPAPRRATSDGKTRQGITQASANRRSRTRGAHAPAAPATVVPPAAAPVAPATVAEAAAASPAEETAAPVRRTVQTVREAVRAAAPVAAPVVDEVLETAAPVADAALRQVDAVLEPIR